jgi:type II secretory pathway pseudopilin PulG
MLEAVVALAVLSIFGGAVMAVSSGGMRAIDRAHAASASASTLLGMDDAIRRAAGRVRIPYWERRASVVRSDAGASIAYFDGEAASTLELDWKGKSLNVSTPEGKQSFSPVEDVRVDPLLASTGELRGMTIDFSIRGKRYAITAHFGGVALSRAGEEG